MNKRYSFSRSRMLTAAIATMFAGAALAQVPNTHPQAPQAGTYNAPDIRDIRGPKPMLQSSWLPWLMAAAALGVGAGCAVWAWRRRRLFVSRSPRQIALERIDAARGLIQEGNSRTFCIELSGIVRQYIEDAFGIVATHLTTDEFLRHFAHTPNPVLMGNQDLLGDFLQACDLAKFGGWNLTSEGMLGMWQGARRFVAGSAPARAAGLQTATSSTPESQETYDSLAST